MFDEIEKCDPKILDVLLHILDEGYATDNLNRTIDFSKTVVIMTSNIGHKEKSKREMGFLPQEQKEEDTYKLSLKKYLRPELLARIDEVLFFNELGDPHLLKIINQELSNIEQRLLARGVKIKWSPTVKKFIFNKIKEKNSHARDIKNLVKTIVQIPLSQFIVKNRKIEEICLKVVDKNLTFV